MPLVDYEDPAIRRQLYRQSMPGTWNLRTKREAKLGMCRAIYYGGTPHAALYASWYIQMGVRPVHTFAIVGSGWGYSVEYLDRVHGYNGVGIDTSAYVQATKDQDDSAEIAEWLQEAGWTSFDPEWVAALDRFGSGGGRLRDGVDTRRCRVTILDEEGDRTVSRNRIRWHFGLGGNQKLDWAISESVIESLSDAEAQELSRRMHAYADNVAHTVFARPNQLEVNANHPGHICNQMNFKPFVADWRVVLPGDYLIVDPTGVVDVP